MGRTAKVLTLAAFGTAAAALAWAARELPGNFGARPSSIKDDRVLGSPQFFDGKFRNEVPASMMPPGGLRQTFVELAFGKQKRKPSAAIPVVVPTHPELPPDGLSIIWYGHSTALLEIEGRRVLFDPVWSDRCSPSSLVGPLRMHRVPAPVADLPRLDAIAISHDHYDHLDMPTIKQLAQTQSAPFLVPLGVAAHLRKWGVPEARIIELDWDETADVAGLHFVATAARHFSGRSFSRDDTLWASWVVTGAKRRVFYTGDSGYWSGYQDIGAKYGPFDATLIQIGAYGPGWPDIHMTPEDGARAHLDVGGRVLIPLHWCTFNLALHAWSEPADRLWREAKARDITLAVPRPGERVNVDEPPPVDAWWQAVA
jgi:L-ascorbate metabolism protein UlaG (beta-lactamase superfamily)